MVSKIKLKETADIIMERMFEKFTDFDFKTATQEQWKQLRWTEIEYEEWFDWAVKQLVNIGFNNKKATKEIAYLGLLYSPKINYEGDEQT